MKIKGNGKIPNYIQIRDDNFTLISYFKANNFAKELIKEGFAEYIDDISKIFDTMNYGELYYIENKK